MSAAHHCVRCHAAQSARGRVTRLRREPRFLQAPPSRVRSASGSEQGTVTGPDGRFSLASPGDDVTVIVRAGGFAEKSEHAGSATSVDVVLSPAGLAETVTVTPTRTELRSGAVPASVSV